MHTRTHTWYLTRFCQGKLFSFLKLSYLLQWYIIAELPTPKNGGDLVCHQSVTILLRYRSQPPSEELGGAWGWEQPHPLTSLCPTDIIFFVSYDIKKTWEALDYNIYSFSSFLQIMLPSA